MVLPIRAPVRASVFPPKADLTEAIPKLASGQEPRRPGADCSPTKSSSHRLGHRLEGGGWVAPVPGGRGAEERLRPQALPPRLPRALHTEGHPGGAPADQPDARSAASAVSALLARTASAARICAGQSLIALAAIPARPNNVPCYGAQQFPVFRSPARVLCIAERVDMLSLIAGCRRKSGRKRPRKK